MRAHLAELGKSTGARLSALETPPTVANVVLGASPHVHTMLTNGALLVTGGTGVVLTHTRGAVPTIVPAGFVPMRGGDTLTILYVLPPVVTAM